MSDLFHLDEDQTEIITIVESLKNDIFLNGKLIHEGTLFSIEEEEE